jgi:hypothetical protein
VGTLLKRAGILGIALVLTLGLAVAPSQAAKPKKAKTEAEIEGFRDLSGPSAEFFGDVHSKKSKCEKGREATLYAPNGSVMGTETTDATGDWALDVGPVAVLQGNYVLEVLRKRVGSGNRKLVCKAATSPPVFIDEI